MACAAMTASVKGTSLSYLLTLSTLKVNVQGRHQKPLRQSILLCFLSGFQAMAVPD